MQTRHQHIQLRTLQKCLLTQRTFTGWFINFASLILSPDSKPQLLLYFELQKPIILYSTGCPILPHNNVAYPPPSPPSQLLSTQQPSPLLLSCRLLSSLRILLSCCLFSSLRLLLSCRLLSSLRLSFSAVIYSAAFASFSAVVYSAAFASFSAVIYLAAFASSSQLSST